jgi:galactose mutarotase-like enzyme
MGYSYLQKPYSERGREFKVSPICLRTAVNIDGGHYELRSTTYKDWESNISFQEKNHENSSDRRWSQWDRNSLSAG